MKIQEVSMNGSRDMVKNHQKAPIMYFLLLYVPFDFLKMSQLVLWCLTSVQNIRKCNKQPNSKTYYQGPRWMKKASKILIYSMYMWHGINIIFEKQIFPCVWHTSMLLTMDAVTIVMVDKVKKVTYAL